MIDIKALTEADLGRKVIFEREPCRPVEGELSSWNDRYVFVRFKGPTGEACEPADIRFALDRASSQASPGFFELDDE